MKRNPLLCQEMFSSKFLSHVDPLEALSLWDTPLLLFYHLSLSL